MKNSLQSSHSAELRQQVVEHIHGLHGVLQIIVLILIFKYVIFSCESFGTKAASITHSENLIFICFFKFQKSQTSSTSVFSCELPSLSSVRIWVHTNHTGASVFQFIGEMMTMKPMAKHNLKAVVFKMSYAILNFDIFHNNGELVKQVGDHGARGAGVVKDQDRRYFS